ncbi:MAG: sensor domain-containing diguanylate cyclase [Treponema sp.]|nr:sensor domain-containing diguanylate cyclase [Treponema sp.]
MVIKSIRTKLTLLLFFIALIPLLLVIGFYLAKNISASISSAESDGLLRNSIVNEHITEHFEKNLSVLRTIARNPLTLDYLNKKDDVKTPLMEQTLRLTNEVFNDSNNMLITDKNGNQLARSDDYPLINVDHRTYFHEAMHGYEYISDVLISLANNRLITVLEVPVIDEKGNVLGMVQRDYDLSALQEYIKELATPNTRVMICDSVGNIVAHSEETLESNRLIGVSSNPAVAAALAGKRGSISVVQESLASTSKKEKMLLCYSQNEISGWVIITERPYRYIWAKVVIDAMTAVVLGGIMLFLLAVVSAFIAEKTTRKIRTISSLLDKAAEGDDNADFFSELKDDELGQMLNSINKIRSSRDSYRQDAEIDKLTGLLNKATFERMCRGVISGNRVGIFSTLIVADLDHFKEVNDNLGHQAGDAVLHNFGEALRKLFRPTDLVGRFGGDEFVVLLNDLPGKEIALQKARRIVETAIATSTGSDTVKISASVGMASTPQHGLDYDSLFTIADKSVYAVKESGRSGYCHGGEEVVRL